MKKRPPGQIKNKDYRLVKYFVGGKMKHYRIPLIEGMEVDEFIRRNADDVYLAAEGHWDILHERQIERDKSQPPLDDSGSLPF